MRHRAAWANILVYETPEGEKGCWLEERSEPGHPWGLGCKVCRWHGVDSAWGRTAVRGLRLTTIAELQRHGGHLLDKRRSHIQHAHAVAALRKAPTTSAAAPTEGDRNDVPGRPQCYMAYKNAKAGAAFTTYSADLMASHASGASIARNRWSRIVAQRLVRCAADVLRREDMELLRACTDIALTMDGRKGNVVVRARLCMGDGMPASLGGQAPASLGGQASAPIGGQSPAPVGGAVAPIGCEARRIANMSGAHIPVLERLLSFRENRAFSTTEELAAHLVASVREACGGDAALFEAARRKIRVFTPDGAADEQLAGRLTSEDFPNMRVVLRCAAHAVNGALRAGWEAEPQAQKITKEVVQEVAKYIRSSERFAKTVGQKAADGMVAALENFSFAPQRFGSRERPLSRFVVFAPAVMEALALEAESPTSPERRRWAVNILRQFSGELWCMIGMLADLSDDCTRFVRILDSRRLDPIQAAVAIEDMRQMLRREYVRGDMWRRTKKTYTARVMNMLSTTRVLRFCGEFVVVTAPRQEETMNCQARLANAARAIMAYLRSQFPEFGTQALFRCMQLSDEEGKPNDLRRLLTILGWTSGRMGACVAEYVAAWPFARAAKEHGEMSDADIWAQIAMDPHLSVQHLRRFICVMLVFLVTETEAERSFSLERIQSTKRPKMGRDSRFDGLKIMCDGLPFEELVDSEGRPRSNFWDAMQEVYSKVYGTRVLGTVRERKDKGCQRARGRKRAGKCDGEW